MKRIKAAIFTEKPNTSLTNKIVHVCVCVCVSMCAGIHAGIYAQ